jgi:hypothetical protein
MNEHAEDDSVIGVLPDELLLYIFHLVAENNFNHLVTAAQVDLLQLDPSSNLLDWCDIDMHLLVAWMIRCLQGLQTLESCSE